MLITATFCLSLLTLSIGVRTEAFRDDQHEEVEDSTAASGGDEARVFGPKELNHLTYGVIVDCGSSGTRVHIYQWDSNLNYTQMLHAIAPMRDEFDKPVTMKKNKPLSDLDDNPDKAAEYFADILKFIEEKIPYSKHPVTGVYIMATAGMRLLDDVTQDTIMNNTAKYIEENYKFARVKTSVISGADEGMYQWISVNAKTKRFLNRHSDRKTKTFAVIEMGGASIQVTYQLRLGVGELIIPNLGSDELRRTYIGQIVEPAMSRSHLLEHNYTLHSTTFLGFGGNSARDAFVDLLIKNNEWKDKVAKITSWTSNFLKSCFGSVGGGGVSGDASNTRESVLVIDDPCLPKGHVEEIKKPKRMFQVSNQTIGFTWDEEEPYILVRLRGRSNYERCKRLVTKMLMVAKKERFNCKPDELCTMDLLGEPFVPFKLPIKFDFLGIGDMYHTMNVMLEFAGDYSHDMVKDKTKWICNMSRAKLLEQWPTVYENEKTRDRIGIECFKAVWVDTFLTRGLLMPGDYKSLKTIGKIGNEDLEWTLGAVLDKSLAIEKAAEIQTGVVTDPDDKASIYSF